MFDVDAPTGSGWWHWIMYNIPTSTSSLSTEVSNNPQKLPQGAVQSINDFGFLDLEDPVHQLGQRLIIIYLLSMLLI